MFGLIRIIFIWASLCTQTRNLSPVDFALFVHIKKEITLFSCLSFYFIFVMIFADFQKQKNKENTQVIFFRTFFFVWCCEWSETILWNYSVVLIRENNSVEFSDVCFIFFFLVSFLKKRCEGFTKSVSNCEKKILALILLMLDYTDSVDGSTTQYIDVFDNYFLFLTFFWYFAVIYVNSFETCSRT